MPTFEREVCRRLPLADAVYQLLDFVTADGFLDDVFERYRGRSYEAVLTFPLFFHLIADTLLQRQHSAHQHFRQARQDGSLTTCVEALYGKLRRCPITLSQGLLLETTQQLRPLFPEVSDPLPDSLDDFEVFAFDGKKTKFIAKKLKALRGLRGQIYGGKLLVVQHLKSGLAVAVQADPDGEAADNGLVAGAVAQVRQVTPGAARLWVGDRLFCDLVQTTTLTQLGDHFLLRYQSKVGFHRDAEQPVRTGVDRRGVPYLEEWGWLGAADDERRRRVRRITLQRVGQEAIVVVSDLLDGDRYPAADLLEVYLRRWGIEVLFQKVTEVFDLRHLIGTTPQATVFQAVFSLVLSNVIQVVQGYVAAGQGRAPATLSAQLLFEAVTDQLTAWCQLVSAEQTRDWLGDVRQTVEQLRSYLRERVGGLWDPRWLKAPTTRRQERATAYLAGGHSSVFRILRGLHKVHPEPKPPKG
jgi:hypothetical protein